MKINKLLFYGFIFFFLNIDAQNFKENNLHIKVENDSIYGTLLHANEADNKILVIFIPGSGPTDRNGNQGMIKTNAIKFLAEAITDKKIDTYRFDQSVISFSQSPDFKEDNYTFSILVNEVKSITDYFKQNYKYQKIILAGHSQGSLVGMLAVNEHVNGFISLNGAGQSIDLVLMEQLKTQVPSLEESYTKNIHQIKKGEPLTDVNPLLKGLFRPSVAPFLHEWMNINPQEVIAKLTIPILIIGGTKDLQVAVKDAEMLHTAQPKSQLLLVENMNHLFKEIKGGDMENQMSYMNPDLPIMTILVDEIEKFLLILLK